ncbi:unnamed protein product [Rhizoctonia solani]|uniref:F-box domain-containing protein n=1 Tax=Rhizoctonia solani TaxID=456999 RepID=A0A8H3GSA7_9AGAM|nr:unnamed protein product [Rhizoctonia solani]
MVLSELPGSEILNCRSVCNTFKRLIDQSKKLQYIIQSTVRGLEPLGDSGSASSNLANLLFRERSWTMFGSIPGSCWSLQNPPNLADGPTQKLCSTYNCGKLALFRGNHAVEHSLYPLQDINLREYEIPSFGVEDLDFVASTNDVLVYSTGKTIHVYSKAGNELLNVLSAPHLGTLRVPTIHGSWIAALFSSEHRCNSVLIWNWKSGRLIDTLHDAYSPVLSTAFFDDTTLAVVCTNRSACAARVDTYELGTQEIVLRSSVSLPDAHPSKWYAKADIYTGGEAAHSGTERMLPNEGIVAIDLEIRIRIPHNPETITADRRLNAILVAHKRIFSPPHSTKAGAAVTCIPWTSWSPDHFRLLTGVRLSPQRPVWGRRLIAVGPESGKISLFDFCPVGLKAVAQVWKGSGTWGASSNGRGGVSVRAALAQRARTLVRASNLGALASWFDNLSPTSVQIPYVVSVRRGMIDVVDTMMDGSSIVLTMRESDPSEQSTSTRIILFNHAS